MYLGCWPFLDSIPKSASTGVVGQACNPSTQEVKQGDQDSRSQNSTGYTRAGARLGPRLGPHEILTKKTKHTRIKTKHTRIKTKQMPERLNTVRSFL